VDLPELDLPPGDYRERKPRGWRWKLHPDHDDDNWTPLVMFFVAVGAVAFILLNLPPGTSMPIVGAAAMFGAGAGAMFMLWTRR
jgi:hypothetical protein